MYDPPQYIPLKPDFHGPLGKAWRVNLEALNAMLGIKNAENCSLGFWIIEAPKAHPFWHSYVISLIHLRATPGAEAARIYREGATHEFVLFAMENGVDREAIIKGELGVQAIEPPNFFAQLVEKSDAAAAVVVEKAIQEICDGQLSPDTDFRSMWIARFGDASLELAERDAVSRAVH